MVENFFREENTSAMASETQQPDHPRALLGLRPPTMLADAPARVDQTPERPDYQVISSGWDSEDGGSKSQRSNLLTALGAGVMLLLAMAGIGLLIG